MRQRETGSEPLAPVDTGAILASAEAMQTAKDLGPNFNFLLGFLNDHNQLAQLRPGLETYYALAFSALIQTYQQERATAINIQAGPLEPELERAARALLEARTESLERTIDPAIDILRSYAGRFLQTEMPILLYAPGAPFSLPDMPVKQSAGLVVRALRLRTLLEQWPFFAHPDDADPDRQRVADAVTPQPCEPEVKPWVGSFSDLLWTVAEHEAAFTTRRQQLAEISDEQTRSLKSNEIERDYQRWRYQFDRSLVLCLHDRALRSRGGRLIQVLSRIAVSKRVQATGIRDVRPQLQQNYRWLTGRYQTQRSALEELLNRIAQDHTLASFRSRLQAHKVLRQADIAAAAIGYLYFREYDLAETLAGQTS